MATKTQWQSQSQNDAENDLGVTQEKYEELVPTLSGFLCDHAVQAKLIFAYGRNDHTWFVVMSHKDNEAETTQRRLPYIINSDRLLSTLQEMYAELAPKAVKKILAIDLEAEPEEEDQFEGW
jgi:hypothetical protein